MSGLKRKKILPPKKKNKFNAKPKIYSGVKYHSTKEADYAKQLDILRRATGNDRVVKVETQVTFPIEVCGHPICKYILDFKVTYPDRVEHVDVKGLKKGAAYQNFLLKKKLVQVLYDIVVLEV